MAGLLWDFQHIIQARGERTQTWKHLWNPPSFLKVRFSELLKGRNKRLTFWGHKNSVAKSGEPKGHFRVIRFGHVLSHNQNCHVKNEQAAAPIDHLAKLDQGGLLASFRGKMIDLLVKDSFLRGSPKISHRWQKDPP